MAPPVPGRVELPADEFVQRGGLWVPAPDEHGFGAHRKALRSWGLHELTVQLPTVQFQEQRLPKNFWPPTSTFAESAAHVRFACAELARHAVLWSPPLSIVDGKGLEAPPKPVWMLGRLVSNALGHRLELDDSDPGLLSTADGVHAFLFPHMSPQWEFMRSFAFRAAQATWMFSDALGARRRRLGNGPSFQADALSNRIVRELGMSVAHFVGCVQMLFARSASENPTLDAGRLYLSPEVVERIAPWLVADADDRVLCGSRLAMAFNLLAATKSEMRAALVAEARVDSEIALLRCPTPFQRHPILLPFSNTRALGVAPVPHLLLEFLYEPLIDLLHSSSRAAGLAGDFNQLFEEYVGLLLSRHSPPLLRWLHEHEVMPPRGTVVDWCAELPSHVVLVDAKRAWLDPASRHRLDAGEWDQFHRTLLRGVRQGAGFWKSVTAGHVPALAQARSKKPVLVLATGSDNRIIPYPERLRRELLEEAWRLAPGLHVEVVWLDQLHALLNTWRRRDVDWLGETLSQVRRHDGAALEKHLSYDVSGPMWRAFTDTLPFRESDI